MKVLVFAVSKMLLKLTLSAVKTCSVNFSATCCINYRHLTFYDTWPDVTSQYTEKCWGKLSFVAFKHADSILCLFVILCLLFDVQRQFLSFKAMWFHCLPLYMDVVKTSYWNHYCQSSQRHWPTLTHKHSPQYHIYTLSRNQNYMDF